MLDVCLTQDPGFSSLEDLALTNGNGELRAYLLGRTVKDIELIRRISRSLIWFTYRRNWPSPIGGSGGPTTDLGWGCMIRCGQMLLAQTLTALHLGKDWQLLLHQQNMETMNIYKRVLRLFQDKRTALYSIHQIAHMGISEGKQIGEWLGPNTMSQVLKKLVVFDNWSQIVVHVALNNVLISSDVRIVAAQKPSNKLNISQNDNIQEDNSDEMDEDNNWKRPLLLMIPLRLGLDVINPCYSTALFECFKLPQFVGILGGRPRHAVYFYGTVGDRLLYLDPHFCQDFQDLDISLLQSRSDFVSQPLINDAICSSEEPVIISSPDELMIMSDNGGEKQKEINHRRSSLNILPQQRPSLFELSSSAGPSSEFVNLRSASSSLMAVATSSVSSSPSRGDQNENNNDYGAPTHLFPSSSPSFRDSSSLNCSSNLSSVCSSSSIDNQNNKQQNITTNISFPTSCISTKHSSPHQSTSSSRSEGILRRIRSEVSTVPAVVDSILDRFISIFADKNKNGEHKTNFYDEEMIQIDNDAENQNINNTTLKSEEINNFDDSSFHCPHLLSMDFKSLDPSLALGFLVRDSSDYENLIERLKYTLLPKSSPPLFEVLETRPKGWPPFSVEPSYQNESINIKEYDDLLYDSDEQFELLNEE
uniref:Cysteine protease n=1 Tax=Meloidogyne hapla TaxID=6305 RepID=A0A1I8BYM0_MELHA